MSEEQIAVLGEHQNARDLNTTNPQGYQPTAEEKAAIKLVNRYYEKAKNARKKTDEKWLDFYKMFRGKQWKETRPSYRHSEVINMIFQMIQADIPVQMDAKPKFEFLPQEPSDREFAEIINEIAECDWTRKNWLYKLTEIAYESRFYGTGLAAMLHDAEAEDGAGDTVMRRCDPFYCFPDPDAVNVNEDKEGHMPEFFVYAEPVGVSKLKKQYPDKAAFIKADLLDVCQGDKMDFNQVRFKSPVDTKTTLEGTSAYDVSAKDIALKITCYVNSDEFEEEQSEETDPETGAQKTVFTQKKKYPTGRKIVIAGGVLLENGPNPYEDGKFPYARYVNYIDPGSFWGIGDIEQLESPQKIFNKLVSFTLDVLTLMGNPIWIVDTTAGIDTENLFNRPGLVVEKEPGSEVRREEGVQLQPYVLQLIDRMKLWFDDLSGSNDVSRGANPTGVTAASAIMSLQDAAKTRTRQKSRNMDAFLQDLGQLYLSRIMQFSTAPKMYRITNNQSVTKYFKFSIQKVPSGIEGEEKTVANVIPYNEDPVTGQYGVGQPQQIEIKGNLDVKVSTGSNLPFAKEQKAQLSLKLFEVGAIDEPALLEGVDYPNWEATWERVKQRRAEAAATMPGPGGPPGEPPMAPPPAA